MPADDFTSCKTKDDPNYDYFACQFFESLTRYQTTDPNGYWFGRLITFEFQLDNLRGENFNEDTFREDLENGDIVFHSYTLLDVNYEPLAAEDSAPVAVNGKVELDLTMNGVRSTTVSEFAFQIRRGWLTSTAEFSEP
ncbi:MAG TPA: hypothetical protein VK400_14925 [Pyrinomonadaceae bacterium]|nr:hypothetical protein [Pyrinomonadaceae bacterium]